MKSTMMAAAAAAVAAFAGCTQYIPSVGPSYEEPEVTAESHPLPDAGFPTTNVAADCSYVPAATNEDPRVEISRDAVAHWWEHFNDPVLEELVLGAATNNLSFQTAKKRLEQANYELLGSYAAFLPQFAVNGSWTLARYGANVPASGGEARHLGIRVELPVRRERKTRDVLGTQPLAEPQEVVSRARRDRKAEIVFVQVLDQVEVP